MYRITSPYKMKQHIYSTTTHCFVLLLSVYTLWQKGKLNGICVTFCNLFSILDFTAIQCIPPFFQFYIAVYLDFCKTFTLFLFFDLLYWEIVIFHSLATKLTTMPTTDDCCQIGTTNIHPYLSSVNSLIYQTLRPAHTKKHQLLVLLPKCKIFQKFEKIEGSSSPTLFVVCNKR
jgi:hypothetical protein